MSLEQDLKNKAEAKAIAEQISNYVNVFGDKGKPFTEAMSYQHRTLQQSFTRLALQWLEYVASDEYKTDARNEQSHEVAKVLMHEFWVRQADLGFKGETLQEMAKPSGHLSHI
jgi:hypothetical protein